MIICFPMTECPHDAIHHRNTSKTLFEHPLSKSQPKSVAKVFRTSRYFRKYWTSHPIALPQVIWKDFEWSFRICLKNTHPIDPILFQNWVTILVGQLRWIPALQLLNLSDGPCPQFCSACPNPPELYCFDVRSWKLQVAQVKWWHIGTEPCEPLWKVLR